jgi:two-component system response regulator FlrC
MSRVLCAVAEPFGDESGRKDQFPRRDFSAVAEKFPEQVLVVDDEPLIRWSICESLARLGYHVTPAPDGTTALNIVTTSSLPFSVVILDLRLPDTRDLSLLQTLRQLLPAARLILMSADATPDMVAGARALGAAVLAKPFPLEALHL